MTKSTQLKKILQVLLLRNFSTMRLHPQVFPHQPLVQKLVVNNQPPSNGSKLMRSSTKYCRLPIRNNLWTTAAKNRGNPSHRPRRGLIIVITPSSSPTVIDRGASKNGTTVVWWQPWHADWPLRHRRAHGRMLMGMLLLSLSARIVSSGAKRKGTCSWQPYPMAACDVKCDAVLANS